jgi:hypothetical protein
MSGANVPLPLLPAHIDATVIVSVARRATKTDH